MIIMKNVVLHKKLWGETKLSDFKWILDLRKILVPQSVQGHDFKMNSHEFLYVEDHMKIWKITVYQI